MARPPSLFFASYIFISYIFGTSPLVTADIAIWGPRIRIGPAHSEIVAMSTLFAPGYPPSQEEEFMALWPGLWNPRSLAYDLIQSVTSVHNRSYMQTFCHARPGQWCTQAYVLKSGYPDTPRTGHAVDGDDVLKIQYSRDYKGTGKWTQIVESTKRGIVLVKFTAGDKPATVMETGTEMQHTMASSCKGPTDPQTYINMTITLRHAEPDFGSTWERDRKRGLRAFADKPFTPDDGKTWILRRIIIPRMGPGVSFRESTTQNPHDLPSPSWNDSLLIKPKGRGEPKRGEHRGKREGRTFDFDMNHDFEDDTHDRHSPRSRMLSTAPLDGCKWGG